MRKALYDDPNDHDHEMMVETIQAQREEQGYHPVNNPPPGPKWQAKEGLHGLKLSSGTAAAVMFLLIDHAAAKTGLSYPSINRMARILDVPERTIKLAIAALRRHGLIETYRRPKANGTWGPNFYIIKWPVFFIAYRAMQQRAKDQPGAASCHQPGAGSCHNQGQHPAPGPGAASCPLTYELIEPMKEEPMNNRNQGAVKLVRAKAQTHPDDTKKTDTEARKRMKARQEAIEQCGRVLSPMLTGSDGFCD
jgi:hypothetical protein